MATMRRCRVDGLVIRVTATGLGRRIAYGEVVDLEERLSDGFTVADAIAGREEAWFEPVEPASHPQYGLPAATGPQEQE